MNIENLERATELKKELDELAMARDLLNGGGTVDVRGNGSTHAIVTDDKAKECLKVGISARIEEIQDEIRKL